MVKSPGTKNVFPSWRLSSDSARLAGPSSGLRDDGERKAQVHGRTLPLYKPLFSGG